MMGSVLALLWGSDRARSLTALSQVWCGKASRSVPGPWAFTWDGATEIPEGKALKTDATVPLGCLGHSGGLSKGLASPHLAP